MKVISTMAVVRKPLVPTTDGRSTKAIKRSTKIMICSYAVFTLFLRFFQCTMTLLRVRNVNFLLNTVRMFI